MRGGPLAGARTRYHVVPEGEPNTPYVKGAHEQCKTQVGLSTKELVVASKWHTIENTSRSPHYAAEFDSTFEDLSFLAARRYVPPVRPTLIKFAGMPGQNARPGSGTAVYMVRREIYTTKTYVRIMYAARLYR